jgi:hypothetical protein
MTVKQKAARAKFTKAIAEAKKLRSKNPKLTQAAAVKQAFAILYGKQKPKKVGAVKKKAEPKKKAAVKKANSVHKDTKSHNVNIRVMSGINYNDPKILFSELLYWQNQLDKLRAEYRSPERKMYKKSIMDDIKLSKKWIENYKKKIRLHLNKVV